MNLPVAPLAGAALGGAVAAAALVLPAATLESVVSGSGLPSILAAAEPPLGMTARLAVAGGSGALVALVSWFGLFLLLGTRGLSLGERQPGHVPVIRRADAHPDAPPRAPLLATRDLGTPFLEVPVGKPLTAGDKPVHGDGQLYRTVHLDAKGFEPQFDMPEAEPATEAPPAEQDLPVNLDQPLAAFDPSAIPEAPMPPPVAPTPLRRPARPMTFDSHERFETFELMPPVRPVRTGPRPVPSFPEPAELPPREDAIARPETDATIHALLDRLERGVARRGLSAPEPTPRETERGLEEALVTLRNLAKRA
ncbi:hypothetical protein [Sphingomonas sp.]|uniref:hypothetical protein n=1 Tax=Sphingomonas sp. TaxID=28214 RepID=UPI001AFDA207|nr:hypothetical protein [Sphingomonas sp.]MBO9711402.1 hypothetical protein [Sphingomonas sp.]